MFEKESYRPKFVLKKRRRVTPNVRVRLRNRIKYKKNRHRIKMYNRKYRKRFKRQLVVRRRLRRRKV